MLYIRNEQIIFIEYSLFVVLLFWTYVISCYPHYEQVKNV
jgi:hypothetical protein